MPNMRFGHGRLVAGLLSFLLAAQLLTGCSSDDSMAPPTHSGTIVITQTPLDLDGAGWTLTGPVGDTDPLEETGRSNATFSNLTPGPYNVTWAAVAGWVRPATQILSLQPGGMITFTGVYLEIQDAAPLPGFVLIEPGAFLMGSPEGELGRADDETQHTVTLTRRIYMAQHEVTEALWHHVMGGTAENPDLPRRWVSWDEAIAFCNALSALANLTPAYDIDGPDGNVVWHQNTDGYRLPTEAEWEYACRADAQTALTSGPLTHPFCSPLDENLAAVGWYCGNVTTGAPRPVGYKQSNAWGFYDLHGNVWEWVWCGRRTYTTDPRTDPATNPAVGANRMLRGGSWSADAQQCRSAARFSASPGSSASNVGFRLVRSAS